MKQILCLVIASHYVPYFAVPSCLMQWALLLVLLYLMWTHMDQKRPPPGEIIFLR